MDCCSKFTYLNEEASNEMDTNIVSIDFSVLKGAIGKLHQGDPVKCQNCQSVLNSFSKILSKKEYDALYPNLQREKVEQPQKIEQMEEEVQKPQMVQEPQSQTLELQAHEQGWVCEFCGLHNSICVEQEEIPKNDDVIYMIQPAQQTKEKNDKLDQSVVFCIDASGSMSTTTQIEGKVNLKHGITAEEYEMLKQFMEPGDEYQIHQHNQKNITHVSRKQCVLAAIESQIDELKKSHPNKVVGIVTFNNEVVLLGDGCSQPMTIAGDHLNKAEDIRNMTEQVVHQIMKQPVCQSAQSLIERFAKLQEKGQTALGPALLSAVLLARAGKPGSSVIICTDGLANTGLGSLDSEPEVSELFYQEVANVAKENGVAISVVTIKGEGCKLEILSNLAEMTAGTIKQVTPQNIDKDFASILKDELVGTKIRLNVRIHKALRFRNEDQGVSEDGTTLFRDVGNATVRTQTTIQYGLKPKQELQKLNIDTANLKSVPFQALIEYETANGDRLMRVFTKVVETTRDRIKAERAANIKTLHGDINRRTANLVKKGNTHQAQLFSANWANYVGSNDNFRSEEQAAQKELMLKDQEKLQLLAVKKTNRMQLSKPGYQEKSAASMSFAPQKNQPQELLSPQFNQAPQEQLQVQQQQVLSPLQKAQQETIQLIEEDQDAADLFSLI